MNARLALWVSVAVAAFTAACSCSSKPKPPGAAASAPVVSAVAGARVDELLRAAWTKAAITPSPPADDATFLRRATLDLWGRLPTPAEIDAFAADRGADKRARLVDRLLGDGRFSDRFAQLWTDLLLGEAAPKDGVDRAAFRSWLTHRMNERAPWDAIVREILADEGSASPGGEVKERSIAAHAPSAEPFDASVHGNLNYLLRYRSTVEDLTGKTSRAFLGIQIQCAQCHDHKTEAWTSAQFKGLAATFIQTRAKLTSERGGGEMRVFEVKDQPRAKLGPKATDAMKAIAAAPPKALDGSSLEGPSRRKALAAWITAAQNPTFAKAFVNRMWAALLGTGFVEPVDDFRPGNKAELPELLDALAQGFQEKKYDVRGLMRTICLSEAYQRSAGPPGRLWSSFALRPLPAVLLFDAVLEAGGLGPIVEEVLGEKAELVRARTREHFVLVLDVDEDAGTHHFEGSIAQALLLANGTVTRVAARAVEGGALLQLLQAKATTTARSTRSTARTLSRAPSAEELAHWKRFLAEPGAAEGRRFQGGRRASPIPWPSSTSASAARPRPRRSAPTKTSSGPCSMPARWPATLMVRVAITGWRNPMSSLRLPASSSRAARCSPSASAPSAPRPCAAPSRPPAPARPSPLPPTR
jgi:hypothetical protein